MLLYYNISYIVFLQPTAIYSVGRKQFLLLLLQHTSLIIKDHLSWKGCCLLHAL